MLLATALVLSLAGIVCAATATAATATATTPELAVLGGDHGPTLPIEAVLAELPPSEQASALISDLAVSYPVATLGIQPGRLRQQIKVAASFGQWLTRPIALVADDDLSRRWLRRNGDALRLLNATVLVVRVRSELDMRKLRALRADLPMAPVNADHLVRSLSASAPRARVGVYPLVIFPDGRLQQELQAVTGPAWTATQSTAVASTLPKAGTP